MDEERRDTQSAFGVVGVFFFFVICCCFSLGGGGGGPYQDRTVNAGVAIGRGLPGGVGGLILK